MKKNDCVFYDESELCNCSLFALYVSHKLRQHKPNMYLASILLSTHSFTFGVPGREESQHLYYEYQVGWWGGGDSTFALGVPGKGEIQHLYYEYQGGERFNIYFMSTRKGEIQHLN